MAPKHEHAVALVISTKVTSHDFSSILVEAGGFTPMRWFLERASRQSGDDLDGEPPTKKRKTAEDFEVEGLDTPQLDNDSYIPISRTSIDLHFPETLTSKPATANAIANDVDFDDTESASVRLATIIDIEDGHRLQLALPEKQGAVVQIDVAHLPDAILGVLRQHRSYNIAEGSMSRGYPQHNPATWSKCTLTRSRGQRYTVLRLEATVFWQSGVSAFPAGVPAGRPRIYPDYEILTRVFPDRKRAETDHTQPWTPQDFYDSVHVPKKDVDVQEHFEGVLESELYPFQKRAVHWMLGREGMEYSAGLVRKIPRNKLQCDTEFFERVEDLDGNVCYVNHLQGIIQWREPMSPDGHPYSRLSGGLLAEEMGLGKTVELMALLRSHPRSDTTQNQIFDAESNMNLTPSKATLIITPASILQQWRAELSTHAPALKALVYEGISSWSEKHEKRLFIEMASSYDVVLATYNTLAREVHFAEDPPERNMRHARKFERKRSPLVRIQWWRICLDEAQMVESGVTNAARVACRLPRIHSWAVSGTPLRKNVQDLHGLLIFLRYRPLNENARVWSHLIANHKHLFRSVFGEIALRHTKAQIREDLNLPPQKRVVVNVPFSAIEEQHYSTLFAEMCEAVRVNEDGSPKSDDWDPEDSATIEAMRSFLTRLRQTCLHPQVGGKNRKALGKGQGPLRTVAEVLEVMIDQKETSIRTEERALFASQLIRAHVLGNARDDNHRSEKALEIYLSAMQTTEKFVKDARERLAAVKEAQGEHDSGDAMETDVDEEDSSSESTPVLGRLRNNLRTTLQLQHACTFFAATSYFQIKSNESLTPPDSDRFKELEEQEMRLYESAKRIRKEILKESARKAESLMRKILDLQKKGNLTKIPDIKDLESLGGIESRRLVEKSDMLFDVIREQTGIIVEWRAKIAEYLLKPLVDEDEGLETTGDEYEGSTKLQDELYAYFDACRYIEADLNTVITGLAAPNIDHEVKEHLKATKTLLDPNVVVEMKRNVHAPELTLELLAVREKFRAEHGTIGSVRGLIQEARGLETSLHGHETGVRAVELTLVKRHLATLQSVFGSYIKTIERLEKEVELLRSAQNQRLEFYRQLQELSDAVQPYKEELDETLDLPALQKATEREEILTKSLAQLQTQNRYLLSLRDETGAQTGPKICVICQFPFENGVLTVCGHQFCKECIQHWWSQARTCPVCKRLLHTVDFHNITYKPQELRAQEEVHSGVTSPTSSPSSSSTAASQQHQNQTSIYSDIDAKLLQEIKSIDLPSSYGTKIDTLGRHLHWLRSHDPGAKSIIFSQYREFLDVLGTALQDFKIGFARLGRAGAVEKFKHDPSIDCLLLDAKTDSSGLTLVNATHVVLCEPLIQTAVELQAIARVHRIGQTRPTTVWMYLVNETVEEAIYEISVARRMTHVQSKQSSALGRGKQKSRSVTPAPAAPVLGREKAMEIADSEELQSQPISKLLVAGKGGGEVVGSGDLWQCLFGKGRKKVDGVVEGVVARHLRAEAAEGRRRQAGEDVVMGGM